MQGQQRRPMQRLLLEPSSAGTVKATMADADEEGHREGRDAEEEQFSRRTVAEEEHSVAEEDVELK